MYDPKRLARKVVHLQGCPVPYLAGLLSWRGRQELECAVDKVSLLPRYLDKGLKLRRDNEVPSLEIKVANAAQVQCSPLPCSHGLFSHKKALYAPGLDPLAA